MTTAATQAPTSARASARALRFAAGSWWPSAGPFFTKNGALTGDLQPVPPMGADVFAACSLHAPGDFAKACFSGHSSSTWPPSWKRGAALPWPGLPRDAPRHPKRLELFRAPAGE
ncbi:hypothetical protein FNF28_01310 [Cafeteria roenbergensis]|uniref:Uncharacterized protein n=1 Tax=Cafeteria roenbergensis TaxID=33653 RepID=A0A5A8E047_CAFRO|nr:hypothetical protein FNF28_01310 [Cafeteria roenbergensis]